MGSQGFVQDDILKNLSPEEEYKLAEFWAKLDALTDGRFRDFSANTLNNLSTTSTKSPSTGEDVPFDMSVMRKKPAQKVLDGHDPATLFEALRRNVKHEDPDTLLVRFLRARSWKPDDCLIMLLKSLAWRIENRIEDALLANGDAHFFNLAKTGSGPEQKIAQEVINLSSSGETAVHGYDKQGRILQYIRVKLHNPKAQSKEGFEKATILNAESTRMLLRSPVTTISIVFDMTGFGTGNMDMNALKIMAGGLQDNYPECLGTVYVYNAPWIMSGIWSLIKAWLDPVVAAKVQFISSIEKLSEFIPIENIPRYMGGKSDWEYRWINPPAPQPLTPEQKNQHSQLDAERNKLLDDYINTTKAWFTDVLTKKPTAANHTATRHALALKLRENYWQIDPYVRGRVNLDREGVLLPGGKVDLKV